MVPDGGWVVDAVEFVPLVQGHKGANPVVLLEAGDLHLETENEMIFFGIMSESFFIPRISAALRSSAHSGSSSAVSFRAPC